MGSVRDRAEREGTPLVDGETATFVWIGDHPPRLIGEFSDRGWGSGPLDLFESEPGVWTLALPFRKDAYIEYVYVNESGRVTDPLNSRSVHNGFDGYNNYFTMPEIQLFPFDLPSMGVPRGVVTHHVVTSSYLVGGQRSVRLYRPPVPGPCPLIVVWDAQEYVRRARLPRLVDVLIAQARIQPIALALVTHGAQARLVEYMCSDATLGVLLQSILPLANEFLDLVNVRSHPGAFGVLGGSLGGLQALYTGLRLPEIFGSVLSQSGAFALDPLGDRSVVYELLRHEPVPSPRVWLNVGSNEVLVHANENMHTLMKEHGYDAALFTSSGGHNYVAWGASVWRGLEFLFPPNNNDRKLEPIPESRAYG